MYGGHSQFDGNAAFSGGGFMPSQSTQTADASFSSSSKKPDTQPLIPLTIKQINEALQANDDNMNFLIDGVDVNNVKLVGLMHNKAERITDVSFTLDDGTGRLECFRWVNEAVDSKEMSEVANGMYVRVHGHLKGFQGKKQLMVFSVRPVSDHNEIAHHFTDCIYVHIYNTKSQKLNEISTSMAQNTSSNTNMSMNMNMNMNSSGKGYQMPSGNNFAGQYSMDGLKTIDKLVLDYLQQPGCLVRDKGVHREELAERLNTPLPKIMHAIETLESEGLVYSTIDECHYKTTANG